MSLTEALREQSRRRDGRFGDQRHANPGQLGLAGRADMGVLVDEQDEALSADLDHERAVLLADPSSEVTTRLAMAGRFGSAAVEHDPDPVVRAQLWNWTADSRLRRRLSGDRDAMRAAAVLGWATA